jgi:hypothetical protein
LARRPFGEDAGSAPLEGEGYRLLGTWRGEARVRVEPFEAFELDLSALWSR